MVGQLLIRVFEQNPVCFLRFVGEGTAGGVGSLSGIKPA